jgi:hypothetical protein
VNQDSLPLPSVSIAAISAEQVYRAYTALADTFLLDAEVGLGGRFLYAGEIGSPSRDLLFAANIAGAASLAASADPAAQREAIRDGVVDFSVTSLEEALRILKNEIRKTQPVSVAVAIDPQRLVEQMLDRGVLPDILPPFVRDQTAGFLAQGARQIPDSAGEIGEFVTWSVDREFSRWMPKLDGCARAAIPAEDCLRQRWLRLAPRYLGRGAQRSHGVVLGAEERARFRATAESMMQGHSEAAKVEIGGTILG